MNEHGSFGSVPSVISLPLVTPSPSQSKASHEELDVTVILDLTYSHGSLGSVPSKISLESTTPSPSVSVVISNITSNVLAGDIHAPVLATTDIVPPLVATFAVILVVVEVPTQPFGSVQV